MQDAIGHGTFVASIAAAAANGKDIQGVAPEATILALNVSGVSPTDKSGNPVTATTPQNQLVATTSLTFGNNTIQYAIDNGAFVLNFSGGGSVTGAQYQIFPAMANIAAKNLLFVEAISNTPGDDNSVNSVASNLIGQNDRYAAWMLFGIRSTTAPSANGNPGTLGNRTLAVNADNVPGEQIGGGVGYGSGNSFAAPAISGAAALMKSYWPQLGGAEIATILLQTADAPTSQASINAGNISGYPLMDLTNAFSPQAATIGNSVNVAALQAAAAAGNTTVTSAGASVSATTSSVSASASSTAKNDALPANAVVTTKDLATGKVTVTHAADSNANNALSSTSIIFSPAFGSSVAQAKFAGSTGNTVVLDKYMRNFNIATGSLAHSYSAPGTLVYGALQITKAQDYLQYPGAQGYLGYTSSPQNGLADLTSSVHSIAPTGLAQPAAIVLPLSKSAVLSMTANGNTEMSQLLTGSMYRNLGITTVGSVFDFQYDAYRVRLSSASNVDKVSTSFNTQPFNPQAQRSTLTEALLTWKNGLTVGFSSAVEYGSALGLIGNGAFIVNGAHSSFARLGWTGAVRGWKLAAEAMGGTTKVDGGYNMIVFNGPVWTSGFRFQADRPMSGGIFTLGLTSPLRVQSASMSYTGPVAYNYVAQTFTLQTDHFNVAPNAREMDLETDWAKPIGARGSLSLGAALTANTGNVSGQTGGAAWFRYDLKFK